jgi:hypothetical protein
MAGEVEELRGAEQFKFYLKVMLAASWKMRGRNPRPTRNTGAWGTHGTDAPRGSSFTLRVAHSTVADVRKSRTDRGFVFLTGRNLAANVNRYFGVRLTVFAQHSEQTGEFADGKDGR